MKRTLFVLVYGFYVVTMLGQPDFTTHQPTIAVIGAGVAGLTAAYRLHTNGYPVSVYEARSRPGGRTFTCYFENGHYEELGGQNLNDGGQAPTLSSLINELGLQIESSAFGLNRMYLNADGNNVSHFSLIKNGPQPTHERYTALQQKAEKDIPLHELLDDFLGTNNPLRTLVEKRTSGYEGRATKQLSTYYFDSFWQYYRFMHTTMTSEEPTKNAYVTRTVKGGMCKLIQALCNNLTGQIHYMMPLRKIERSANNKISLTFDDQKTVVADIVILAIPCSTLRNVTIQEGIIPADQQNMINTLQYGTNAKILIPLAECKQKMAPYGNQASALICEKPIMWCYFGGQAGIFDSSNETTLTNILEQEKMHLDTFFPNAITDWHVKPVPASSKPVVYAQGPVGISWVNEEFSRGSYSALAPGQYKEYNKRSYYYDQEVRTVFRPIDNAIFFAGEHTSLENPSTMEGAADSGEKAARKVMRFLQQHRVSMNTAEQLQSNLPTH